MHIEHCYTSSNCNQTPTILDWGKNNLVCYGSKNSVLIYDPKYGSGGKVINTLVGHSKRVNSLRWLSGKDIEHESELVSGSADGTVCVWTFNKNEYKPTLLTGHDSNVNIVDGLYRNSCQGEAVIVSASMDSTLIIWTRQTSDDNFIKSQTINFGYNISVGLRLYVMPTDEMILGCCLDNSKINIYVQQDTISFKLEPSIVLSGHEDWVRGLGFTDDGNDILMASCSQDSFIRIWRLTPKQLLHEGPAESITELKLKTNKTELFIYVDSVLTGHESWVYSVHWCPTSLQLLSASIDKTLIIWKYYSETGMWMEKIRVGEVGGNTLGFYGGLFSPTGKEILAHSYNGAFHMWREADISNKWVPCVTVGGHFSEVVDCAWEPKGEFLISAGADQTVRIHAPWADKDKEVTWHEIARSQVHGYDMSSLAVVSRYCYASGAEEKVIRVFQAPVNFVENFRNLCSITDDKEGETILNIGQEEGPKGACVPSLGLSNKAVFSSSNRDLLPTDNKNAYPEESHFTETHLAEPPTEETLLQNTLWPEIHKLYGHGYEVYSLDASPDGKYLASASKSTKPEYAAILIWDTTSWKQIQKLMSHTLTVVQMKFSPDSKNLLSVSRDRRWSLFSKPMDGNFELVATTDKKTGVHSRIIWTCAWSHDSKYFTTGSRDGKLVTWTRNNEKAPTTVLGKYEVASEPLDIQNESVTAVAFAPELVSNNYLVAIGLDCGLIYLYNWCTVGWKKVSLLSQSNGHHLTVRRLVFRPQLGQAGKKMNDKNVVQLASCSSDNSVKVYNINIT